MRNRSALQASLDMETSNLENIKCIHGHFQPLKYLLAAPENRIKFVTWMRDPVDRLISHFNFWQRSYNPKTAKPHHKKVVEEDWSLEQFCLSSDFKNIYCQYLWAFPLEYFDFIGITEHFEEDLAVFSEKYLEGSLNQYQRLVAKRKSSKHCFDSALLKKIEDHHSADIALYQSALKLRQMR